MTCNVEHLFICLCAINIWMYALVRCLFGSFAHFLIRLFILLLFSSLYILDNGLLSNASFINISPSLCITFSSSWHCLLQGRSSNLMKSILPIISLMNCAFSVVCIMTSPNPKSSRFLLCYLLGVLWFCILYLSLWSTLKTENK